MPPLATEGMSVLSPTELPRTAKAAIAAGSKFYFTGSACKRGHVGPRRATTGVCLTCIKIMRVAWQSVLRSTRALKEKVDRNQRDQDFPDYREWPFSRAEAKACGHGHFFSGTACANGHHAVRLASNGCCVECSKDRFRVKRNLRSADASRHDGRRTLVVREFPWTGRFRNKYEVSEYFNGAFVQCLICGVFKKSLVGHLPLHSVQADEYKERFGLPKQYGLTSLVTRAAKAQTMARRWANGEHRAGVRGYANGKAYSETSYQSALEKLRAGEPLTSFLGKGGFPDRGAWRARMNRDIEFSDAASEAMALHRRRGVPVSRRELDAIVERVRSGLTITQVLELPNAPAKTTLVRLRRNYLDFGDQLRAEIVAGRAGRRARRLDRSRPLPNYQLISGLRKLDMYAAVEAAVPKGLPAFIRDDIKSEIILAVLDGEIDVSEIRLHARAFVSEYFREFGSASTRSLDAPLFSDGKGTLLDRIAG